jgi:hypothetical protein
MCAYSSGPARAAAFEPLPLTPLNSPRPSSVAQRAYDPQAILYLQGLDRSIMGVETNGEGKAELVGVRAGACLRASAPC